MVIDWLGFVVLFACFCNLFLNSYSFLISTRKSCEPSLFSSLFGQFLLDTCFSRRLCNICHATH